MSAFHFKAATRDGELVTGTLHAPDLAQAVTQLRSLGRVPLQIDSEQQPVAQPVEVKWSRRRISASEIESFTRDLGTLLAAGIALDRALGMLADLSDNPAFAQVINRVRQRLQEGDTLAEALAQEKRHFPPFAINLVRAGEAGGMLAAVLTRLAEHQERARTLRDSVTASLIYPAVLVGVAVLAVLLLLTYVVPQFAQLFTDVGQALPLPTRIVIGAGEFLQHYGWSLPAVVLLGVWGVHRLWQLPTHRARLERLILATPLLGKLLMELECARLARTVATLLSNGVPLVGALRIASRGVGLQLLVSSLDDGVSDLNAGKRLSDALQRGGYWPRFALQLIRVGEESGALESMLERVAQVYERTVQTSLKRALALLEPALILVLGVVVAGIVLSILVAILAVNQLVV